MTPSLNGCSYKFARRSALFVAISLTFSSHTAFSAEDEEAPEEIVITGSYIRNSPFAAASPVDTINQDSILESGSANIGQFIRDLPYTQNVDTVANVLGGSGGGQDSNSAQFNLRGLGTSSTLTLFDGRRNVNPGAISAILPDIATSRIEVVLDGGSALYGADAVAGVVNIIPIKEYEGLRVRSFYNRDNNGDFEEPKLSLLFGHRFDDLGLDFVGALEIGKKTALQRGEREKYLRVDNATFIGAPGTFIRASGPSAGSVYRDQDCGTYNGDNTDKGKDGSFPSGYALGPSFCGFHYAQWTDYNREAVDYNGYMNLKHETTSWLTLEYQSTMSYRESIFHTEPLTPLASGWYPSLIIPANHPANPTGVALMPGPNWTMINGLEKGPGAVPSYLDGASYQNDRYGYYTTTNKIGGTYSFGDTSWTGETWISYQGAETRYHSNDLNVERLRAGLSGQGGAGGNEWFNPFASRDINSPSYQQGVTNNSQELMDWMFESGNVVSSQQRLRLMDSIITGEVLDLPAGTMSAALGVAVRDVRDISRPAPLNAAGINASSSQGVLTPAGKVETYDSMTKSVFGELEIPILDNLSMQIAARYEEFPDLNLDTTTPKVAVRYQPLDSISLRASWGESFLAPGASQIGEVDRNNCAIARSGADRLTGDDLLGVLVCTTRNPNLAPETSEIFNAGFTWEGFEGLTISLDYQTIEYADRIIQASSQDITNAQFYSTMQALGIDPSTYSSAPGSATRAQALSYIAANPRENATRDANGTLTELLSIPENLNSNTLEVIDLRAVYAFDVGNIGSFTAMLDATYFKKAEYAGLEGVTVNALGRRNADTAQSPPMPKLKASARLNWTQGNHTASVLTKYLHSVTFDGTFASGSTPPTEIDASYIVNTSYSYYMDDLLGTATNFTFGVTNVFDWEPRRLPVQGGFESRLYDNFGRQFFASVDIEL